MIRTFAVPDIAARSRETAAVARHVADGAKRAQTVIGTNLAPARHA